MPVILALDTSLSMQRIIPGRSEENVLTYHQLALKGISQILDHLVLMGKLEYVALVIYGSASELRVDFTRDYDQIKQSLKKIDGVDKSCFLTLMKTVAGLFNSTWGTQTHNQVVVFSDCGLGFHNTSLRNFLNKYANKDLDAEYACLSSLNTVKWNFICLGINNDNYFTKAITVYQQLLDLIGIKGQFFVPKALKDNSEGAEGNSNEIVKTSGPTYKSELGRTAMFEMIEKLCESNFKHYEVILNCGSYNRLECSVVLWPPPLAYYPTNDEGDATLLTLASKIEVCGYLALADIGSPASLSRHLVIPKVEREKIGRRHSEKSSSTSKSLSTSEKSRSTSSVEANQSSYDFEKLEQEVREFYLKYVKESEDGSQAADESDKITSNTNLVNETNKENLCVLLHGVLKMENLAALVWLNDNWYGFLYAYADTKKKSNLMLNILPPGNTVIPWLGDMQNLGFVAEDVATGDIATFPVKADKRSYSQSCVVWINRQSLQSDVQKVLRHAKKMPEKIQNFYKELNRIRRAALSIGFVELLDAMATLFERESLHLATTNANPDCILQLKHVSAELRKPGNRDVKVAITPFQNVNPLPPVSNTTLGISNY